MQLKLLITVFSSLLITQLCIAQIAFQQNIIIDESFGAEEPNAVVAADVDGDGFEDMIVSGWNKVVWYKNLDGLGDFSATNSTVYFNDYGVEQVKAADFDGDNDIDVIFFLDAGNGMQIVWCENMDGMGTFSEPEELILLENWLHLRFQIADIDGDTDMDIGFGHSSYIGWLENDGQAAFTTRSFLGTNESTGNDYDSFFLIDIDNDNRLDLMTDDGYDLRAFKHEDNGSITLLETMSTFSQGSFIDGGDIDSDGDNDIVFIFENGGSDREIIWYQNMDGLGTFSNGQTIIPLPSLTSTSNGDIKSLSLNDIDDDGKIDVVFHESRTQKISFYKNLGHAVFDTEVVVDQGEGLGELNSISVKDVDNDGALDIMFTSYPAQVSWFKNIDGLGTFGNKISVSTAAYSVNQVEAGDIDGDGDLDVVSSSNVDHKLAWYRNTNGLGDFTDKQIIISDTALVAWGALVVDIDGDHDADVLAHSLVDLFSGRHQILWMENDGTGNFIAEHIIENTDGQILHLAYADVDGDNDMDLISAENNSVIALYKNNGDGTFQPQNIFSEAGSGYPLCLQVADMDGDDDIDVLASYSNSEIVWYENLDGLGDLTEKHVIVDQMHYPIAIFAADIDGDNDKDVLFANRFQTEVGYFINTDGLGTFGPKVVTSEFSQDPATMYAMDIDHDGDNDMVTNTGPESKLLWFENDGSANFGEAIEITVNTQHINYITSADFNSDGKNDVMTASFENQEIAWYKNLGSFSNTISGVVHLDIDSNGCTDQDQSLSHVLVTTTNDNNTFSTFTNANGHYTLQANQESFETAITSALPMYYISNPLSDTHDFTGQTGVIDTSDFCIETNETINDLTISVYPSSSIPRPGFDTEYQLVYRNNGTTILSGSVVFEFDDTKIQFLNASETVTSQTPNTLTFDVVDINPFETRVIQLEFNVFAPPTSNIDDVLAFTATVNPIAGDQTPEDNVFNFSQTLIGSYDPNDITVLEGDEILLEEADKYLHYVIRFQNTGTASAINVNVENILDDKLDWATIQLEGLSHAGRVEIMDGNQVKFIFNNIHLPDSTSNESDSHGFIAYKIKPKNDVVIGDVFNNTADIFFDFNPPITTNTASTEIVMMTNTMDGFDPMHFSIYPNPAHEKLMINSKLAIDKVSVFDAYGRLVKSGNISNAQTTYTLNLTSLSPGIYFVEVQSGSLKQVQKFMLYP